MTPAVVNPMGMAITIDAFHAREGFVGHPQRHDGDHSIVDAIHGECGGYPIDPALATNGVTPTTTQAKIDVPFDALFVDER